MTKHEEQIQEVDTYGAFKSNFYDYGMSVIEDRAIPDVRDGLKPVHRAIVFEMLHSRYTSKNKYAKVKKISGAVIGNWHPHGDSAVEEALVGLAVPWKNTLPIIDIKGNQGSVFGDSAASGRYIEAKLHAAGDAYGYKLKKGIVPFVANFDNTAEQPTILPAQLPYLLINGISDGIAVGVATALPPHNAKEVLAMTLQYMKNPKTKTEQLLELMPGPDFPTGATIINKKDLLAMYESGQGKLAVRSTMEYTPEDHTWHVREIPFSFAGSMDNLVSELVAATSETTNKLKKKVPPKIEGVQEVRNYSDKNGIDIAIKLAKGVDHEQMLQTLFAKTRLETTVKFMFQALNDRQLQHYSLRQYLKEYVDFQHEIVTNEHVMEQADLNRQMDIIMGRIIAAGLLSEIIDAVRNSTGRPQIKDVLMNGTILEGTNPAYHATVAQFRFNEIQAEAISGLPLYQLNKLDRAQLIEDGKAVQARLHEVERLVSDEAYRHKFIVKRLEAEYKALPDVARKTRIVDEDASKATNLDIPEVPMYIGMDRYGYVRIEYKPFEGATMSSNYERVGFFDEQGNCWNLFMDKVKETKERGTLVNQLLDTTNNIVGFVNGIAEDEGREAVFVYADGSLKRCDLSRFMTKTRATKVNTRTAEHLLASVHLIPDGANTFHIGARQFGLHEIPLQTNAGSGVLFAQLDVTQETAFSHQEGVKAAPATADMKPGKDVFDGVVVFDESEIATIDWTTLDTTSKEGVYVTTYQKLINDRLVFVHKDGTAKIVDGKQFEVKTRRSSLVANKVGCVPIYIAPVDNDTLVGIYEDGVCKRIAVEDIATQGKTGGGVRVFYTTKYTLDSIIPGDDSDIPIVSFATQPKPY